MTRPRKPVPSNIQQQIDERFRLTSRKEFQEIMAWSRMVDTITVTSEAEYKSSKGQPSASCSGEIKCSQ